MVELMVVVIIMAILGLAVMPSLVGSSEKAKYSRAWSDLNAIANAFTAFYGRVGNLPGISGSDLTTASFLGTFELGAKDLLQSFLGTPLAKMKDPWGAGYGVKSSWNSTTRSGHIIVYVTGGDKDETVNFGGGAEVSSVRLDPYNGDRPMAKLVINVM